MGYTHYFKNKPAFTDSQWAALTEDVKKLIKNSNVPLGDANGEIGSKPVFNSRHIMFNGIGDPSSAVTPAPIAPGAPTGISATGGNGSATVSFTAPSDGGSAITGYTVTATPAGGGTPITATGTSSPITVTGLTNGTSYTFTATATNAIGTGTETNIFADNNTVLRDIETILFDKYRLRSDDASAASLEIIEIVCKHLSK